MEKAHFKKKSALKLVHNQNFSKSTLNFLKLPSKMPGNQYLSKDCVIDNNPCNAIALGYSRFMKSLWMRS
jgi:hypothetical protein